MKKRKSTQNLMGLETFGRFGLCANRSELAFFHVQPTNISVLSAEHIDTKIHQLTQLLSVVPELLRVFSDYRMLAYSVALVLIMIFKPTGLFGEKATDKV